MFVILLALFGIGLLFANLGAMSVWVKVLTASLYGMLILCGGLIALLAWRKLRPS